MTGDERKRFCSLCKLNVYNISAMTLPEAEKLITEAEGRVCVRMFRRADGTVITQDCPVGLAERVKRRVRRTVAVASAACAVVIAWAGNVRLGNQPSLFEQIRIAVAGPGAASTCGTQPGRAAMMGDVAVPAPHRGVMGKIAPVEIKGEAVAPDGLRGKQ